MIVDEVLGGGDDAAGLARAHHDRVFFSCLTFVTVVLLIDAVEFNKLLIVAAKAVEGGVGESGANIARKVRLFGFHELVLGEWFFHKFNT